VIREGLKLTGTTRLLLDNAMRGPRATALVSPKRISFR